MELTKKYFFIIILLVTSCSSIKEQENISSTSYDNIVDDMFFYQARFNDIEVNDFVYGLKKPEFKKMNFTSFEVMFFLDKLRKSKTEKFQELISKSETIYSIEYRYNRELFTHYWNDSGSFSLTRKSFASKTEIAKNINQDIPRFYAIKQEINNGLRISNILDDVKEAFNDTHKKSTYIISRYKIKEGKVVDSEFSIW